MIRPVVAACVIAVAGWMPARAAEPIGVGAIFPLSGGAGRQGQEVVQAMQAMAVLINADGGVLGRPVQIVARDDESTPAVGVAKANELAAMAVPVIIEGWNSPVTLAMQPILARAGILDITAISKADGILASASNPLAIRLNSSNAQDAAVVVHILDGLMKTGRLGFVTENDAYGNGAQQGIAAGLKAAGLGYDMAGTERFPFAQTDFRVELTSLADAKPDAVVVIDANEGAGLPAFLQQYAQARLAAKLVCSVGTVSPSVIQTAGAAADGVVSADIYFPDAEPFASNAVNQRFIAQMQAQWHMLPDKYMALGAAALQVWAKTANALQTLDRKAVAEAIRGHAVDGTILGRAVFAETGQLQPSYAVFTVTAGKMVIAP